MPLTIGEHLGPYSVTALLGRGGMGEVYKALDTRLQREVAIKVSAGFWPYSVSADGQKILVMESLDAGGEAQPITVVTDWLAIAKRSQR